MIGGFIVGGGSAIGIGRDSRSHLINATRAVVTALCRRFPWGAPTERGGYSGSAIFEPFTRWLLGPGNYTAIVRGNNNTTGVGLAEVYNLRPQSRGRHRGRPSRNGLVTGCAEKVAQVSNLPVSRPASWKLALPRSRQLKVFKKICPFRRPACTCLSEGKK